MKTILTVHATMTGPGFALTGRDVDRRDRMHGFSRCGYHFVIERDGVTWGNRRDTEPSLHDGPDDMDKALSVCLVGGTNDRNAPQDNFTLEQWQALRVLLAAVGPDHAITSVRSKTPALTDDRINQQIWRKVE